MANQEFYEENYKILNDAQKEVVEQIHWPVMVVAWPWTGKTQIIWMRTANIILKGWVSPENILITTFTEAWVIAIKKRLTKFIGSEAYKVKVATIHSFSQDIITSYPEKFAEYKALNTIDDIESLQALTTILDTNIKNNNIEHLFTAFDRYLYLRDIKDRIWKLKWEWINPDRFDIIISQLRSEYDQKLEDLKTNKRIRDLEKRTKKDSDTFHKHVTKLTELNLVYREYQSFLRENSLYDFSDMINFAVQALEKDSDLREDLAEKFQFIMLDEYQDTNNSQNKVMDLILSVWEDKNIMVVWDDDQSIYRFQWANIENMLDFSVNYPATNFIVLKNNYRSAQSILDYSIDLIEHNSERLINRLPNLKKELIAHWTYKDLDENKYVILQDEILEKLFVLDEIKSKNNGENTFAIICRSNKEVWDWTKFMGLQKIDVESKLKTNILNNKFVEFILNFLKLVENPNIADEIFLNILRTDIIDVENIDVITLTKVLYKKNYSKNWFQLNLWTLLKDLDKNFVFTKEDDAWKKALFEIDLEDAFKDHQKLLDFRDMILELNSELWLYWITRLFRKVLDKTGLLDYIESHWNFSDLEDIYTLLNMVKWFEENKLNLTLHDLLHKFELHRTYWVIIPRQILKKSSSNIEILTAHSSKGLEYDYVYVPWVYGGNWEWKRVPNKLKLPLWITWSWLQFSELSEKELKNIEKDTQMQEDRRLFFVAITRAKKGLIFSRPAWKGNKPLIDSPFIVETWIQWEMLENTFSDEAVIDSMKKELLWEPETLIQTSREEIEYISEFLETYKLSPTDLNVFLEDPKDFLKRVVFKYPFTGNEFTVFGNIYHKVLETSTNAKIRWETPKLWEMTEEFLKLLQYQRQILTSEEFDRLTKKWLEGLTWYYEHFVNSSRTPLAVEYNFRSRDVVFWDARITWKIDKVEKIWESLNNSSSDWQSALFIEDVAVVDYKTWWIKTEGKIKGVDRYWNKKDSFEEWKYYRQLLFYKLLAENDSEFSAQFNISELALDFVEWKNWEYKYVWIIADEEDYTEFKDLVTDSWEKINSLEYWEEVLKK